MYLSMEFFIGQLQFLIRIYHRCLLPPTLGILTPMFAVKYLINQTTDCSNNKLTSPDVWACQLASVA